MTLLFKPAVTLMTGTNCTMKTLSINDFDTMYRQYGPMVLRRCRALLRNEDKALDAMQDVFVRLIERKEKISKICSSFLYTVATNVCLNKINADRLRSGPDFDVIAEIIEDNACSYAHQYAVTLLADHLDALNA